MKRRKRKPKSTPGAKRKSKQDSIPSPPAVLQEGREEPPATVEVLELQDEIANAATPAELGDSAEIPAPPVVAPVPPEKPAPKAAAPAPAAADRRAHPRFAFTAAVEVAPVEPGARIKTRIRDLSLQGCFVDTDTPLALGAPADVRITKDAKSFEARARVVFTQAGKGMGLMFTAVASHYLSVLDTWLAESRETSWLAVNRRRSQRVLMKLPVRVTGQIGSSLPFDEETHTLAISVHGALLVVAAPVYRGQQFALVNIQTKSALECVVVHVDRISPEQTHVGVEFMLPNPTFWHVAFPPKDWTPRHPDAKSL